MKKTITALVMALSLSNVALAGEYEDAARNEKTCDSQGNIATRLFAHKEESPKSHWIDSVSSGEYANEKVRQMNIFDINYAYDKATSEKDAFVAAWAHCMDVVSGH